MILPLRRFSEVRGRSRRVEFWAFQLFLLLGFALAVWLDVALGTGGERVTTVATGPGLWASSTEQRGGWLTALFALAMLVPWLCVGVRRLHDVGWRGAWLLLGLVPLFGGLVLLVLFLTDGQRGANRFGPDPKDPGAPATA